MKRNFARHIIPDECETDNGPQFVSHDRGNGKAESAVKTAKDILKNSRFEDSYLALLAYRNTPQQGYQ